MYVYSAKNNAFFKKDELEQYEGWSLQDAIDVDDSVFAEFTEDRTVDGLIRIAGKDGLPAWGEIPPPTHEELVEAAEAEKQARIDAANAYMNSKQWPGKAAMGRLNDSEKKQYNAWLDYLDALYAVDTSTAPDIKWPTASAAG